MKRKLQKGLMGVYRLVLLFLTLTQFSDDALCQTDKLKHLKKTISIDTLKRMLKESNRPFFLYPSAFPAFEMSMSKGRRAATLEYTVDDSTRPEAILVSGKPYLTDPNAPVLSVIVKNESGDSLPGASLVIESSGRCFKADIDGRCNLPLTKIPDSIYCTYTGYSPKTIVVLDRSAISITMYAKDPMDALIITGYGTVNKKNNTSNIQTAKTNLQTPGNIMGLIGGSAPGLLIKPTSGVYASSDKILLRGALTFLASSDPYIVIDGIPQSSFNQSASNISTGSAGGSLNPLAFLNRGDIESVTVLTDAAATAIYGSKGANGVILITTKYARREKWRIDIDLVAGISSPTRRIEMMTTPNYVAMRHSALDNDRLRSDSINAPEINLWPVTTSNDNSKWLIAQTGRYNLEKITVSHTVMRFNNTISLGYFMETSTFPTTPWHQQYTIAHNSNFASKDSTVIIQFNNIASFDYNQQFTKDPSSLQTLTPNAPTPWDPVTHEPLFRPGNLNWYTGNPWAILMNRYYANSQYLLSGINLRYRILPNIHFILNMGVNKINSFEFSQVPLSGQYPKIGVTGKSYTANTIFDTWIVEPQVEFLKRLSAARFDMLMGQTFEGWRNKVGTGIDTGFTNDRWLRQPAMATWHDRSHQKTDYKYKGSFARITANIKDLYLLNFTIRRDASNRINNTMSYGIYWAVGAGWVVSGMNWFKKIPSFLSYAKLRGSVGLTGNDNIGGGPKYASPDVSASVGSFQNLPGSIPAANIVAANPVERIEKLEGGLELGMFNNKLYMSIVGYRDRSLNQLLPDSFKRTSPAALIHSLPVQIQNSGVELSVTSNLINMKKVSWDIQMTASFPVNRLISKKGLLAEYSKDLVVGKSINSLYGYTYLGVNRDSGVNMFLDRNKDNSINENDKTIIGNPDPTAFGAVINEIRIGRCAVEIGINWKLQKTINYLSSMYTANYPGSNSGSLTYTNYPASFQNYWSRPGDNASYRKLSAKPTLSVKKNYADWISSDGSLERANLFRLTHLNFSWDVPANWIKKAHLRACKIAVDTENWITISPYKDLDPDIPQLGNLPPLKKIQVRVKLTW